MQSEPRSMGLSLGKCGGCSQSHTPWDCVWGNVVDAVRAMPHGIEFGGMWWLGSEPRPMGLSLGECGGCSQRHAPWD